MLWIPLDVPPLLGIVHRNPTGKILETSQWPRPLIPSDWWKWGCFPEQSRPPF